jgi:hypothetical protein
VRDQPAGTVARSCSAAVGGAPAWCASGGAAGISGPSRYLCEWQDGQHYWQCQAPEPKPRVAARDEICSVESEGFGAAFCAAVATTILVLTLVAAVVTLLVAHNTNR